MHALSNKKPYKLNELLKKLKKYGIVVMTKRGKGSEVILLKPESQGSQKGPQYPIKNHGRGTEISTQVIDALLRRFNITDFWN